MPNAESAADRCACGTVTVGTAHGHVAWPWACHILPKECPDCGCRTDRHGEDGCHAMDGNFSPCYCPKAPAQARPLALDPAGQVADEAYAAGCRDGRAEAEAKLAAVRALLDLWESWDGSRPHPGESSPRQREQLRLALGTHEDRLRGALGLPALDAAPQDSECAPVRVGFRYRDGEVLSPEREARSEDEELPIAVVDLGDGEWLTLAELRDATRGAA